MNTTGAIAARALGGRLGESLDLEARSRAAAASLPARIAASLQHRCTLRRCARGVGGVRRGGRWWREENEVKRRESRATWRKRARGQKDAWPGSEVTVGLV